jgi:leukotriene-A4 hydrolase
MPPSFPYGGMENPYLTFVSPSILLGDKSSAYIAAHEICHSWFGNLVTNKNWTHFWLNEGFTKYSERLIIRKHYNETRFVLQSLIGNYTLQDEVNEYIEANKHECTKLSPNLYHDGPDDIMSDIPYEKGFFFLVYLEVNYLSNNSR